ncbi:nitrite reductase large subunit NirB [Cohnella sp. GCM10027633]|uniref:nitrite reductase large subunit NirB n=1 Tax=unclassified Cohnella TaxID=2636738 RepID=UPI00362B8A10
MKKLKLVLIGNGMAGVRCIEEIMKLAPDTFDITIIGKEPHPNYNRIMLSKVLQGDTRISDITINDWQWYKDRGITLHAGDPVVAIDTAKQEVVSEKGAVVPYDRLVIATGSLPFMLNMPGGDLPGVTAFRDIADCNTMLEASRRHKRAVVIGGGLLGLEAARGLLNLGMEVNVVHINRYLMERQLDADAAELLRAELESQGMRFLLEKQTDRVLGRKRAEGLQFKDGTRVLADLVVMAVGIRPNVQLAIDAGIAVNRAIVVNDRMETSMPNVYAVGECAEHRGMVYGLVAPLYDQGKVLAKSICGAATDGYQGSVLYSQLKVSGIEVFSAGEIRDSEVTASLKVLNTINRTYKRVTVRDDRIVGAVLFGDSSEGNKLLGYIKQGADVSVLDAKQGGGQGGDADEAYVSELSDKETICSCNGVTKGMIATAIRQDGLETFEQVRECTRASSSCGGCKPLVCAILKLTLENGGAAEAPKETVCACTSLDHDELRLAIKLGGYGAPAEARVALGWGTTDGCEKCVPATSYYIGASGVVAGAGSAASAPALADGTYRVQPRTYGGYVGAGQLRSIADAIEAYGIPLAKLGEGRVDLLGVARDRIADVVNALGMPVAQRSYGYPIAVISCDGIRYDPLALQDSAGMAEALERRLERLQAPTAISAAVSGSPLHRAGTLAADVGIVGAPGGWEIHVGGSARGLIRQAQLLCTESDDHAALDMASAYLQSYADNAWYGETTGEWIDRVGLINLRELLFNRAYRAEMLKRLGPSFAGNTIQGRPLDAAAIGQVR